ncbi:PAS domain-containing protein [Bradyrhizobium sp. AZCC 2262]|uniref:hypothetical protein n=1 Tax=Bradyrhizobium sp. AZCC 2262 TaxID=3117022 RepID=UPI002FF073C7
MSKLSFLFCDDDHLNAIAKKALNGPLSGTSAHAALHRLKAAGEKHSGLYLSRSQQIRHLSEKRRDRLNDARDVERNIRHYGETPELLNQLAELTSEAAEFGDAIAGLRNAPQSSNLPIETAIGWMPEQTARFVDAPPVKVDLTQGFVEAVSNERAKLDETKRKIIEVNKRPLPKVEAEARLRDDVNRIALKLDVTPVMCLRQQAREHVMATRELPAIQGHVAFPTRREIFEGGRTGELDEAFRFLCWIMPDAIIAKGMAELDALYKKSGTGLSVEERARVIAGLDAEYLEIERREEALIRVAEDRGESIWRRPQASISAVLGITPA